MTLPMDQEVHNLALLKSVCQRSLRDQWRNSRKVLAVNGPARPGWLIWFVLFIWLISFNQKTKQTKQTRQTKQRSSYAGGR